MKRGLLRRPQPRIPGQRFDTGLSKPHSDIDNTVLVVGLSKLFETGLLRACTSRRSGTGGFRQFRDSASRRPKKRSVPCSPFPFPTPFDSRTDTFCHLFVNALLLLSPPRERGTTSLECGSLLPLFSLFRHQKGASFIKPDPGGRVRSC